MTVVYRLGEFEAFCLAVVICLIAVTIGLGIGYVFERYRDRQVAKRIMTEYLKPKEEHNDAN